MGKKETFYIKILFLLNLLTIFLAFLSLNRLGGILFNFPFRIYLEHFLAGFYAPLLFLFSFYTCIISYYTFSRKEIKFLKRETEIILLIIFSLIYFLFEIWWQFYMSFNYDSIFQFFFGSLGTAFLWFFLIKLSPFHNK